MPSNLPFIAAIAVLFVCVIGGRVIGERALRQLTPDEKVRLVDAFSSLRIYAIVPLALILIGMIGVPNLLPNGPSWLPLLALPIYLVYMGVLHVLVTRKLAAAGLPAEYRRQLLLSRNLGHAGLAVLFATVLYEYIAR